MGGSRGTPSRRRRRAGSTTRSGGQRSRPCARSAACGAAPFSPARRVFRRARCASLRRRRTRISGDVDLDHVRRAGDVDGRARGDHDAVAALDDAALARGRMTERDHRSSTSSVSGIWSGVTPHSSAMWRSESTLCVSATIGRRGRSRATAEAVRPVNVGTSSAFADERLRDVARRVRHRLADRRLVAAPRGSRAGSRGWARPRARSDPSCAPPRRGYSPIAVSPESISADVPSRTALATSDASARVGSGRVDHRLQHLRRRDHGLPTLERAGDDPLLQERHVGRPDLDAEVAARDHHRRAPRPGSRRGAATASAFSILAITQACDPRASISVRSARTSEAGAHERERDVVHAHVERELEIVEVLARERRDRQRDAREVDALVASSPPRRRRPRSARDRARPPRRAAARGHRRSARRSPAAAPSRAPRG